MKRLSEALAPGPLPFAVLTVILTFALFVAPFAGEVQQADPDCHAGRRLPR
jgi:hypothetical protein